MRPVRVFPMEFRTTLLRRIFQWNCVLELDSRILRLEQQLNNEHRIRSNTVTGTLAVDGCGPAQAPRRCTKCNSPQINGQRTNVILFDVAL